MLVSSSEPAKMSVETTKRSFPRKSETEITVLPDRPNALLKPRLPPANSVENLRLYGLGGCASVLSGSRNGRSPSARRCRRSSVRTLSTAAMLSR
jgi:hypothetical protein